MYVFSHCAYINMFFAYINVLYSTGAFLCSSSFFLSSFFLFFIYYSIVNSPPPLLLKLCADEVWVCVCVDTFTVTWFQVNEWGYVWLKVEKRVLFLFFFLCDDTKQKNPLHIAWQRRPSRKCDTWNNKKSHFIQNHLNRKEKNYSFRRKRVKN